MGCPDSSDVSFFYHRGQLVTMRGTIDLFTARIILGFVIVGIFALYLLGIFSQGFVSAFTCEQNTIQQVSNWIQKMSVPAANQFSDKFVIQDCVEYIDASGIKFKSQKSVQKFNGPQSLGAYPIKFDFEDFELQGTSNRITPRSDTYDVTLDPPDSITIENKVETPSGQSGTKPPSPTGPPSSESGLANQPASPT